MKGILRTLSILFFTLLIPFAGRSQVELMSYNVRFANETDGENSWSKRKEFISNQLKFHEPHILGVQEAVLDQLEYFEEHLNGYDYVGVARDDGKTKGEFSAIFYDSDRFELLQENTFWLSETPEEVSKGWDAALPRICTYALFEDKESEHRFWVFNTHFDHVGERARKESAKLIWQKIQEINSPDLSFVLMGDLNLEPDSEGIQFLSEKMNDSKTAATQVSYGPDGTFNAYRFHEPVTRRIDYIFTAKEGVEVLKYGVLSDSKELRYPSDHFPVVARIRFTE